jgi:hypothetical protein
MINKLWIEMDADESGCGQIWGAIPVWVFVSITDVALVDVWRDNHVLIFYTVIYCHYAEHTDELQLDDLPVAG